MNKEPMNTNLPTPVKWSTYEKTAVDPYRVWKDSGRPIMDKLFLTNSLRSSNRSKQAGVGIVVKKTLIGCIIENVTVNERLCYIKFAVQQRTNLIVILCYAPTNEADIQTKESFWNTLTNLTNGFRERERKCLIGDLNAEPGSNKENEHLMVDRFLQLSYNILTRVLFVQQQYQNNAYTSSILLIRWRVPVVHWD